MRLPRETATAAALYAGVVALIALQEGSSQLPWALEGTAAALVAAQVYLPIWRCDQHGVPLAALGLSFTGAGRAVCQALVCALVVLPPYLLVSAYLLQHPILGGAPLILRPQPWAAALLRQLPVEALAVALPEEVFFRGYLQLQLGGRLLPAAALFALAHVAGHQHAAGLWTFFPGLMFGWLRQRSPSLLGCIFLHALCNLVAQAWLRQFG